MVVKCRMNLVKCVPDLNSLAPVTEILSKYQIVHKCGVHKVQNLPHKLK